MFYKPTGSSQTQIFWKITDLIEDPQKGTFNRQEVPVRLILSNRSDDFPPHPLRTVISNRSDLK